MSEVTVSKEKEAALRQLIAQRAYEIWENQGRPQGCDLIHWREAEQEVMESAKQASEGSGVPDVPARPEQPSTAQRRDEKTGAEDSESLHGVVQVSRSFFALVVPAD